MNFIVLAAFLVPLAAEATFDEQGWEKWKKDTYDKHLSDPKSFLNAISLVSAKPGERLYLIENDHRADTRWSKQPRAGLTVARNQDGIGILTRPGKADQQVTSTNKRWHWTLANGAIAEIVYGTSSNKVWGYLYDPDRIKQFAGFRFYPFDKTAIVDGVFTEAPRRMVSYRTVQGDQRRVATVGKVDFQLRGKKFSLPAYNWQDEGETLEYIALIFADAKANLETYGGGRELAVMLDGGIKNGQKLVLDFNRTGNFYCAHSPFWHCPTGLQTKIDIAVNAGEMLSLKKETVPL